MDFEYGCSTTNKFMFFDESDVEDPSELLAKVAVNKEQSAKDSAKTKSAAGKSKSADAAKKTAGKKPLQQQTDNSVKAKTGEEAKKEGKPKPTGVKPAPREGQPPKEDKENTSNRQGNGERPAYQRRPRPEGGEGGQGFRGPRPEGGEGGQGFRGPRPNRGDRPPRPRRTEGETTGEPAPVGEGEEAPVENAGGEGGFKRAPGTGGFRGPRGNNPRGPGGNFRGGYRGPRRTFDSENPQQNREFDRHSGSEKTGVKSVDKKDGAGKGNWGTPEDELAALETLNETQGETTEPAQNWGERVEESEDAKKEEGEDKEAVPNMMTLDEYKALKNKAAKKSDFNIRRAGEGEDLSKWGKTYVLPKKAEEEEEEEEEEEAEEEEEEEEEDEEAQKKNILNQIQIKFYDSGRERRNVERRGPPRRPRQEGGAPKPEGTEVTGEKPVAAAVEAPASAPVETAVEPLSPPQEKRRPFNRDNQKPRRPPTGGKVLSKEQKAPKFDDEKDFPSLGK